MFDLYTARQIAIFIYPIYGYLIYKWYRWPKFTPYIAWGLLAYLLWTMPWSNYAQKPFLIKKVIQIYQVDKIQEKRIVYKPEPLVVRGWGGIHPKLGYDPNAKASDMVFRLLVWEDMTNELIRNRAWFGMGFSHPLRSPQIEMLHIAEGEWRKDGWIMPHNSYLDIIYRAGILGVIALGWLFWRLWDCFKTFCDKLDTTGLILCLCLSYWLLRAFFWLNFELPAQACPLWALVGLIFNRAKGFHVSGHNPRFSYPHSPSH